MIFLVNRYFISLCPEIVYLHQREMSPSIDSFSYCRAQPDLVLVLLEDPLEDPLDPPPDPTVMQMGLPNTVWQILPESWSVSEPATSEIQKIKETF